MSPVDTAVRITPTRHLRHRASRAIRLRPATIKGNVISVAIPVFGVTNTVIIGISAGVALADLATVFVGGKAELAPHFAENRFAGDRSTFTIVVNHRIVTRSVT